MAANWTDPDLIDAVKAMHSAGDTRAAAIALGCTQRSVQRRLREARHRGLYGHTTVNPTGPVLESVDDLIARRIEHFDKGIAWYGSESVIEIDDPLPIGIVHVGDPHLDDDGTDLRAVRDVVDILRRTEGFYGACVGDYLNNWGPKHAHLWPQQGTTADEAWKLCEWFLTSVPRWAYLLLGNHDLFSGPGSGALPYILRGVDCAASAPHEARLRVMFPVGDPIRIWARHSWPGRSMWNVLHGQVRGALMGGYPADVMIGGHTHNWGDATLERPNDGVTRLVQVGTFKRRDDYAASHGYQPNCHGAACVTILNPTAAGPGRVRVLWDVAEGAEYLGWLRAKRA